MIEATNTNFLMLLDALKNSELKNAEGMLTNEVGSGELFSEELMNLLAKKIFQI